MRKDRIIAGLILVFVFSAGFVRADIAKEKPEAIPTVFSGRVVDQAGCPVAGAAVHAIVYDTPDADDKTAAKATAITDGNGCFAIDTTGASIRVTAVKKEGYQFDRTKEKEESFSLALSGGKKGAEEPVTFQVRKVGEPAYLLRSTSSLRFEADKAGTEYIYHPAAGVFMNPQRTSKAIAQKSKESPSAVKVSAALSEDKSAYLLSFACQGDNGVIVGDEVLFEAPADGYQASAAARINIAGSAKKTQKYAYVRAKDGEKTIYSRLDFDITAGKAALLITSDTWTNPDGSRNLEYNEQFQKQKQLELQQELMNLSSDKNASPEQVEKLRNLIGPEPYRGERWDFDGNRRRAIQEERKKELDAEGRTRVKKRSVSAADRSSQP